MNVLFVCLGNICRSPTAEGVFRGLVEKDGLDNVIKIDSAGTCNHHVGERADPRMREHALGRGYNLTSIARQFDGNKDFEDFNYIVVMDASNYRDVLDCDQSGKYEDKVVMMTDFCSEHDHKKVPDPYYGGPDGFELVIDIVEDASRGLLEKIKKEI